MKEQELLDREKIRLLMARYNIHGDRGKLGLLAQTFCEDGILTLPFTKLDGRAGIVAGLEQVKASGGAELTTVRHHLTTSLVEFVSAGTAKGRTYFTVITNVGLDHSGVYYDTFRKVADEWLIAERSVRLDFVSRKTLFLKDHYTDGKPKLA